MRNSRVVRKLRDGQPVICTKMNTVDPMIMDMIGLIGFDCVWMCNEHGALDWDRLGHLVRTASMNDMDTLVRVAKGSYSDIIRPLELGATGLMIPHCMSEAEARQIVQRTRFHPIGLRPLDGGNSDGRYTLTPLLDYMREANESTFVIVQIEDPQAFDQIELIAAVEGIDVLFVGPADLSQALGVPGQVNHPKITETIARVAEACRKSGKNWGLPVTVDTISNYVNMGARFLACGADVLGLKEYYCELRKRLEGQGIAFSPKVEEGQFESTMRSLPAKVGV
jgi:4-hydroxy-2-oxoheptanedioate aldolase